MNIDELFEKAKDMHLKDGGKKIQFKMINPPVNVKEDRKNVVFEVVDAFFGFLTYAEIDGFFTKNELKEIVGKDVLYEFV